MSDRILCNPQISQLMKTRILNFGLGALFSLLVACQSYRPKPIDWQEEAQEWHSHTNVIALNLAQAGQTALILNPAINALRLEHLKSERLALAAGWWEDPEFDLDLLRILRSSAHPWILESGVSFAIPINGVPRLERRAAETYVQAAAHAIDAAERELLQQVQQAWFACQADRDRVLAQQMYQTQLRAHARRIVQLVQAGELPTMEEQRVAQELLKLELQNSDHDPTIAKHRNDLLVLLGLPPAAPLSLSFEALTNDLTRPLNAPGAEDLLSHPRVLGKLAQYDVSETELRIAIRKQYPDLHIGPLFAHEEGLARAGGTIGFNIPLWNRNRHGIAQAAGNRDLARQAAIAEWRGLVAATHGLAQQQSTARQRFLVLSQKLLPEAQTTARQTQELFAAGETDVLALLAADQVVYETHLNLIEAQEFLRSINSELRLLHPTLSSNVE